MRALFQTILCMVGSRGLGKLRGSRRVGACSSAPREAAPTDDYEGSDRGLTRGAPRVSGSKNDNVIVPCYYYIIIFELLYLDCNTTFS